MQPPEGRGPRHSSGSLSALTQPLIRNSQQSQHHAVQGHQQQAGSQQQEQHSWPSAVMGTDLLQLAFQQHFPYQLELAGGVQQLQQQLSNSFQQQLGCDPLTGDPS